MKSGATFKNLQTVRRGWRSAAILFVALLGLAACGGDAEDSAAVVEQTSTDDSSVSVASDPEATDIEADGAADDAAPTPVPAASDSDDDSGGPSEAEEGQSPLEAALGFGNFDDEDSLVEMQRQIDREVQSCMVNQGFEYELSNATSDVFAALSPGEDLPDDEYAAQYGFGISTNFETEFGFATGQEGVGTDPNIERLAQMPPAEAAAYEAALFGQQPDIDPATGQPIDPETGEPTDDFSIFMSGSGCFMQAQTAVFGNFQVLIDLEDEFAELEDRIRADPRVAEISAEWSTCMAERGHVAEDPIALEGELQEEYFQLQSELMAGAGGFGVDGATPEISPEFEAKLVELQERERTLAVANFECDDNFEERVGEISASYEREFIEQNADAIAEFNGGG